jgi:hypothetical protein
MYLKPLGCKCDACEIKRAKKRAQQLGPQDNKQ